MSRITTTELECGMPLIVERMPNAQSVAMNWLLPVGSASDPPDGDGLAALLSELIFRGAGERDSRQHSDALDRLGVQRSASVLTHHLRIKAVMTGDRLLDALPLLVDIVREPQLPEQALDPVRRLCVQSLESLNDDPQHMVMLRLRERHLAPPLNRHGYGTREVIEQADIDTVRDAWQTRCVPHGSILSLAGDAEADVVADELNRLLTGWSGEAHEPRETAPAARGVTHDTQETAQVHIALAYDAPPEADDNATLERLGIGVLSGSTSGRLFTEVRQKRSLCYSVGASYRPARDHGLISLYAGTTPDRAQETLDVCIGEIQRLREGAREDEFTRAVNGLKSNLVMSGESTSARAAALAQDHFRLGRARTLDEINRRIDSVTLDQLNRYLAQRDPGELTVTTIGPTGLHLNAPAEANEVVGG